MKLAIIGAILAVFWAAACWIIGASDGLPPPKG